MENTRKPGREIFRDWRGYLLAIALVAVATWLKYLAQPDIIPANVPILYILAIVFTATFFGLGPSIFCCVLSLAAYDFFFLPPIHAFTFDIDVVPISLIFLTTGVVISYLSSNLRKRTEVARKEVIIRRQSEAELITYRGHLEDLVKQRTAELEKANLDLKQEIAEHKKAEQALKESEEKFRLLVAGVKDYAIYMLDPSGKVVSWNEGAKNIKGYTAEEIIGRHFSLFYTPEDMKAGKPSHELQIALGEGRFEDEGLRVRKDSSTFFANIITTPIMDTNGRLVGYSKIVRDITERKEVEEALRKTTDYLENLFNYANAPIIVWNPEFKITRFNHAFERLTGRTADEVLGRKLDILFPDDSREASMDFIHKAAAGERWDVVEIPIVNRDEAVRIVLWNSATMYAPDGKTAIATIAQGQDITERKKAEEALRETTDYLDNLFNYANAPIIVWDPEFKITRFNHAFERLTGRTADEVLGRKLDILFPDDSREASMDFIHKAAAGERWDVVEIPIVNRDGTVHIVLWNSATLYAPDGKTAVATIAQGQDITEPKKAEEALRETRDYLENLFNYANAPIIVWDPEFKITRFNHAFERLTGRTADEVLGRKLDILFPDDSRVSSMDFIGKTAAGERWDVVEIPILNRDGTVHVVLWNSATLYAPDGKTAVATIAQGQDITERKIVEKSLAENQTRLERSQELAHLGSWELDLVNNRLSWSDEVYRIFGLKPQEFAATYEAFLDAIDPEDRTAVDTAYSSSIREGRDSYEIEHRVVRKHTGEIRYVYEKCQHVRDESGKIIRSIGMVHDFTERKKAEEELRQRTAELEVSNKELEAFSYSVSHDLRAPLRSMEGFSSALLEDYSDKVDDQGKQYLKYVQESSELMARLIDDLLKLSRVTRSEMSYEKVNLSEMAQKIVADFKKAEPHNKARVSIAPGITVNGDPSLLRVALENLLGNAWKFSGKAASPQIEVGFVEHNGRDAFFIRDNGVGFDMTYADKLFQPFQRLHKTSEFAGTGIGLATVQRIIRRHGGEVWAESQVGKGATFYFTLV